MTREGAPFGGIVSERRFDDGNTNLPIGEVLLSEAHLFPGDSPIQNRKEYCVIFESATVYRFFWSENQNYVVKEFLIDSLALPQFTHCDEHRARPEGDN